MSRGRRRGAVDRAARAAWRFTVWRWRVTGLVRVRLRRHRRHRRLGAHVTANGVARVALGVAVLLFFGVLCLGPGPDLWVRWTR